MKIVFYVFLLLNFISHAHGQGDLDSTRLESTENRIKSLLLNQYGIQFKIDCLVDVDSNKSTNWIPTERCKDPYLTLQNCFIFIARAIKIDEGGFISILESKIYGDSLSFLGIYKNNGILWLSNNLIGIHYMGNIFAIDDINRDGDVDILLEWEPFPMNLGNELWVFSWNGSSARRINPTINNDNSIKNVFDLIDIDADGVDELLGYSNNDSDRIKIFYKWNGSNYVKHANITLDKFTKANKALLTTQAYTEKRNDTLSIIYRLTLKNNSKQNLKYFYVTNNSSDITVISPNLNWDCSHKPRKILTTFFALSDSAELKKGETLDGVITKSALALPTITSFYAQANPIPLSVSVDDISLLLNSLLEDIYNNSYKGTTIGFSNPVDPLVPSVFLDTLISYTKQSVTLGWLAQKRDLDTSDGESNKDSIATNLIKRLQTIKSTIQQGNLVTARTLLQKFIDKVEAEHARGANRMSDECYALLKYNSEYLRDKLPLQ